jgi:hypothetical protein
VSATAVATATTAVESTTGATTTGESTSRYCASTVAAATNCASAIAATRVSAAIAATVAIPRPSVATVAIAGPSVVSAAIAVAIIAPAVSIAAIPGAGPDKEAAVEPAGSIVSIRSTSVGIIAVVAIGADRSGVAVTVPPIHRATDPNSDRDLSMGISRSGKQQDTEQSEIA